MKNVINMINILYVILVYGVKMNVIIFECLNNFIKVLVDRSVFIIFVEKFLILSLMELESFKKEMKCILIEIFGDVMIFS